MNKKLNACIIGLITIGILAFLATNLQTVNAASTGTATASVTVLDTIDIVSSYNDSGSAITFGSLAAGTSNNEATNHLIISIQPDTNVKTTMNQRGNATFTGSSGSFNIDNLTYYNTDSSPSPVNMTTSDATLSDWTNIPVPTGSAITKNAYYWLNIPNAQSGGGYQTTIYINVVKYT